jgi:hypothetical protein
MTTSKNAFVVVVVAESFFASYMSGTTSFEVLNPFQIISRFDFLGSSILLCTYNLKRREYISNSSVLF